MEQGSRIYVAGHTGLLGQALVRALGRSGHQPLLRTRAQLDLRDAAAVERFFAAEQPEYVILSAARVGGIMAVLADPTGFLAENLAIQQAIMGAALRLGVKRLLFIGTSAMYPKEAPQPMSEEALWQGPIDPALRPYSVAKLAGLEMCAAANRQHGAAWLCAVLPNLYGPGDHYEPGRATVIPSTLRKAVEARAAGRREIDVWGSGEARRELLLADEAADACLFLLGLDEPSYRAALTARTWPVIHAGAGRDWSITELTQEVCAALDWPAELVYDRSKPEGVMRKLLDSSALARLGWQARVGLREGVLRTYEAALAAGVFPPSEEPTASGGGR